MAQKKRKFRLKRKAWVEYEIMESGAFRGLPGTAMWILLRFVQKQPWSERKVAGHNIRVYENSSLTFTYSEAKYFNVSSTQFYRSIKTLIYRGFLDVQHRGGSFGIGCDFTTYKLSDRWRGWGDDLGKPRDGFENVVEKQLPSRGIGFAARKNN